MPPARRFLNDALQVLWPAFDRALGAFLKGELEPLLRASSPAAVDGCSFEALSFGATPMQAGAALRSAGRRVRACLRSAHGFGVFMPPASRRAVA